MSNRNFNLNELTAAQPKSRIWPALTRLIGLLPEQRGKLIGALLTMVVYSFLSMLPPALIGYAINNLVASKIHTAAGLSITNGWIPQLLPGTGFPLVLRISAWLLVIYLLNLGAVYLRTILMGGFGQHLLYTLRNAIFNKLQELPVAFFAQNKAGDLISRINNDTDKVNQFFSQSLMQFVSSIFIIIGAGIALVYFNWRLGLTVLAPAVFMWLFNKLMSSYVKRRNAESAKATGSLSAEIQESLNNFKVVLAFNRRDYFRKRFEAVNTTNYSTSVGAGIANGVFAPVYSFLSSMGQLVVLLYGIYLIKTGLFTPGFLIAYFMYTSSFYDPLRQLAQLWAGFQVAIASWDRISHLLNLETDLVTIPETEGLHGGLTGLTAVPSGGQEKGGIQRKSGADRIPECLLRLSEWERRIAEQHFPHGEGQNLCAGRTYGRRQDNHRFAARPAL
jgi:ATP-binding cassette, subfamily B, bacterial